MMLEGLRPFFKPSAYKVLTRTYRVAKGIDMPTKRLNQKEIAAIKPPASGQVLYWDDKLKGFGLRATPTTKTFIVQGRVHGRDCRVAIGKAEVFTPEQARERAKDIQRLMAEGIDPNKAKAAERAKNITLQQLFDEYITKKTLRDKTLSVYHSALDRCFKDWKEKEITEITRDMVEQRYNKIGNAHGPRGKGDAQASQAMRLLGSLYNYAMNTYEDEHGKLLITENPVKRLAHVKKGWSKVDSRQSVILTSELHAFYAGVKKLRNQTAKDYLMLLVLTGLRRNEALGLRWDEIDLKNEYLVIPSERTKNKQPHGLPLPTYLLNMLKRRSRGAQSPFVFPGGKDPTTHYSEPKSAVRSVSENMGKKFMAHDCRRTFITVAERLGIDHYSLKKLMNHSGGDITGRYVIVDIDRLREPMNKINEYILEQMQVSQTETTDQ